MTLSLPTARRCVLALTAAAAAILCGVLAPAPVCAAGSDNLIVNGDFSAGRCTTDWSAVTTVPGWTVAAGAPTLVCYATGTFATPEAPPHHSGFVANGPYGDAAMTQSIDVTAAAAAIDTGRVTYTLSGWLGGWSSAPGQTDVSAGFFDGYDDPIPGAAELGGVDAAARGDRTGFLARSVSGRVPAGTRTILVRVRFSGTAPFNSVAYADQLALTLSTPIPAPVLKQPHALVPGFDHVFVVMMENTDYAQLIGDTFDAPFINGLAGKGTLLAAHSGVYHPSDENYLAVAGGATFVQGAIYFPDIHVAARNLGDLLETAGKTWKAYEQGMGTPCNLGSSADANYAPDDAPFANFSDIAGNPARCAAHLFDTTQLAIDLQSAATTPNFSWIAADYYYDGELPGNGAPKSLQVQDHWLKRTLTPIFASPAWTRDRSLLILTWDESAAYNTNHVATILLGSQGLVRAGIASDAASNHYGIARTIEAALGLPAMTPNDGYARPFNEAFSTRTVLASLATTTPSVSHGARVSFSYATPLATYAAGNQIAIYAAGATPGQTPPLLMQTAADQAGSLSFATAPLPTGQYAAWYLYDDGVTPLAPPVVLNVTP